MDATRINLMQYILTEEELNVLKSQQKSIKLENTKKLQQLCTKIAQTMPIYRAWSPKVPAAPWGCIITKSNRVMDENEVGTETFSDNTNRAYVELRNPGYCDDCPVKEICPSPSKRHSQ